jgi:hypothetical protein
VDTSFTQSHVAGDAPGARTKHTQYGHRGQEEGAFMDHCVKNIPYRQNTRISMERMEQKF